MTGKVSSQPKDGIDGMAHNVGLFQAVKGYLFHHKFSRNQLGVRSYICSENVVE